MRDSKKLSLAESIGFWLVVFGSAAEQLDDLWNASRQISKQQMDREFRVQLVLLSWTLNGTWSEFLFTAIIYVGQREYLGKAGIKGGTTQEGSFSRIFYLAECENLTSVGLHRTAFRRTDLRNGGKTTGRWHSAIPILDAGGRTPRSFFYDQRYGICSMFSLG